MCKLFEVFYRAAIVLWVGGLWSIGYIAAPILFSSLEDRQLAGMVAGKLFAMMGWVGLGCTIYLVLFLLSRWGGQGLKRAVFWLVAMMALMTAASLFGIQPLLAEIKASELSAGLIESVSHDRFVLWHGVSSILYLMQSMLGLWLVIWSSRGLK